MSENKKLWVGFINFIKFSSVNACKIYDIEVGFPGEIDYLNYQKIRNEARKNKELEADLLRIENAHDKISEDYRAARKIAILPDRLWLKHKPLPNAKYYLFRILNGRVVLTEACAELLKQFRLGETTLTPVKIYHPKTKELCSDETFYFLNIAERRYFVDEHQDNHECLEYEKNNKLYRTNNGNAFYCISEGHVRDNMIKVSTSARDCDVDLWHDPYLQSESIFISDELHNALKAAKMDKLWNMHFCKLV